MNIYEDFITYLKEKENSISGYTEKHRIIPGHSGGTYNPSNVVRVIFEDHYLAHFYRYLAYEDKRDLYAYHKMVGDTVQARISRSKSGGEAAKNIKVGCFKDPECRRKTLIIPGKSAFYNKEIQRANGIKRGNQLKLEGFYSSENQSIRGKRGAEINRKNGTGFFDPKVRQKGRERQKELGILFYDRKFQRRMNLKRWGVVIENKRFFFDLEQRTYLSDMFVDYHLEFGSSNKYNS